MPRIEICGSSVECLELGSGEPVILLHSSGSSGAQWRVLGDELSDRYRVIMPDLYGYGATPNWPGRGPFCLGQEAAVVRALLERCDAPAHLVGHSYGGAVALNVARSRGAMLRSLTLIEPVAFHLLSDGDETDLAALHEIRAIAEMVAGALACGNYAGGFGRFVDYWSGPGAWDSMPPARREALAPRLAKVALDFHATINEPTRLDQVRALEVATLLVQGERTTLPAKRICKLLAGALPRASLKTIGGAGHLAPMTHRDAVNDLIVAHLDANAAQPRRTTSCKTLREAIATQSA